MRPNASNVQQASAVPTRMAAPLHPAQVDSSVSLEKQVVLTVLLITTAMPSLPRPVSQANGLLKESTPVSGVLLAMNAAEEPPAYVPQENTPSIVKKCARPAQLAHTVLTSTPVPCSADRMNSPTQECNPVLSVPTASTLSKDGAHVRRSQQASSQITPSTR